MNKQFSGMGPNHPNGFSLIEMMVSVLIFSFVVIGIYFFFDKGNWLYLHSQSRGNIQDNARLAMEFMERELRMASFGVPQGTNMSSASPEQTWLPDVFLGAAAEIGFRGDVDNVNTMMTLDATSSDAELDVENPTRICPAANSNIVIVHRGRAWQGTVCTETPPATSPITISPVTLKALLAEECEIYTPDHVWYRLSPDSDSNGTCDLDTGNVTDNYNNCLLQRCILSPNSPTTSTVGCNWETVATNVDQLTFSYFEAGSTGPVAYTNLPLSTADLFRIDKIGINMKVRGRADIATLKDASTKFQEYNFTTEVLVRKRVL